jgi:allophanate hydrolase subunit 2
MKDGVTGGNYASVGTVITADLDRVAQSKTHETTRFVSVSLDEALDARAARRQRLSRIRHRLRSQPSGRNPRWGSATRP